MPCVDCGLRTGRVCDGCLAAVRVPSGTMPVTEGKLVVVPYTAWKFVLHACQVLGPGNVRKGFVGQSDFMFKVCWQGYTLGALGIQVWRWTDSRPRDSHSTDIMLANHRPPSQRSTPPFVIARHACESVAHHVFARLGARRRGLC